mmetsp:Transcript_110220/g.212368  ORF Transcript_110220/g.212368 Transcript_110220/m.212368 type:complete len:764 (-) Transcript_110220:35-2326(-)
MVPTAEPGHDLENLMKSATALHWVCWRNSEDMTAVRALDRLRGPMMELMTFMVVAILDEMRSRPNDVQVQAMGVHIIRALIADNETTKQIVLRAGGAEVLVQSVQHHPTDEDLLSGALKAIDEIHGLPSLLQALEHLKTSVPGVRAALWAFSETARARWSEVQKLDAQQLMKTLLSAMDAHRCDHRILITGLALIGDVTLEREDARAAFAVVGGWEWTLQMLEQHADISKVQLHGMKLLSSLSRGGSWTETYAARAAAVLERAMCRHDQDDCVMYWALWAVQQLNGARALVLPLRSGVFKTHSQVLAAFRALGAISYGQGDGASVQEMPPLIDAVVHAMGMFSERYDVLYESTVVLGHAGSFVVWGAQNAAESAARQQLLASALAAVKALVELINFRFADASTVKASCEALGQIADCCHEDSPVRELICTGLFSRDGSADGEWLLSRVSAAHMSNERLQMTVMWITGIVHGAALVVRQMLQHASSVAIQLPAIRTLGLLYGERIEVSRADEECLPDALRAVVAAMTMLSDNIILQQNACYALGAMAEHDSGGRLGDEAFVQCAAAAVESLRSVRGRGDGGGNAASYNALYLRKEATRCIGTLCGVRPSLGPWLRERGLQELLADTLRSTADSVWDGHRDAEAEETLRLELLALSYVLGPSAAILETLRRWGSAKPAVARAAADAVVELARCAATRQGSSLPVGAAREVAAQSDAAASTPVQALRAAGCGVELFAVMQSHSADDDLQGRLHLAMGFVGSQATAC